RHVVRRIDLPVGNAASIRRRCASGASGGPMFGVPRVRAWFRCSWCRDAEARARDRGRGRAGARVTRAEAAALAAVLELDVDDIAICHACLSFVSLAIDSGNERQVAGSITRMAPGSLG